MSDLVYNLAEPMGQFYFSGKMLWWFDNKVVMTKWLVKD